jgi:hypothetical protein
VAGRAPAPGVGSGPALDDLPTMVRSEDPVSGYFAMIPVAMRLNSAGTTPAE